MPRDEAKEIVEARLNEAMVHYLAGRIEGFDTIYDALAGRLRSFLQAQCRDAALADDLLQDTFLQLHRSRHTYEPGRPVIPWAFAIAHHVYLMHRRAATRRERFTATLAGSAEATPSHTRHAEDTFADRDRVKRALANVPKGQREVVILHHAQGWSFSAIAARLGIHANAARIRAFRGLRKMRDELEKK